MSMDGILLRVLGSLIVHVVKADPRIPSCSLLQTRATSIRNIHYDQESDIERTVVQLHTNTSEIIPKQFNRCALVGSSSTLSGKGHGPGIDAYDTVIRVNRLPTPEYFTDFGQKTSIFFASSYQWRRAAVKMLGGEMKKLDDHDVHELFSTLVMTSWSPEPNWDDIAKHWQHARYPVGHAAGWVMKSGFSLAATKPGLPTTGLFAVLTFAPICESMDMFGFGGEGAADNHTLNVFKDHHLTEEHRLVDRIIAGTWTSDDIIAKDESTVTQVRSLLTKLHGKMSRIQV